MIVNDKIMHYVLYKKRTENEIRKKCNTLHYTDSEIDEIIEYLKEAGYINDEIYIKKYINDVKILKHLSIAQIKNDLIKRGIDSDLIENITYDEDLKEYEYESVGYLLNKKIKAGDDVEKVRKFLLNKGYSYSSVSKAIDNLENIEDN